MRRRQLHEGEHLHPLRVLTRVRGSPRPLPVQKKRRYTLVLPPRTAPWAASSSEALKNVFGEDDMGAQAMALFQSSLQPGTLKNYGANLNGFFEFCDLNTIAPLDVSPVDIARYIAWLGERGTVAATSMQPYLSAINKFLQDHARPPVALGPLVSGVRKGLEKCQRDSTPTEERLPLPAPVALSILEEAENMLPLVHWDPRNPRLLLLRASIASIVSYVFFNRGECSALCLIEDLVVTNDHITLRLREEKGHKALRAGMRNTRQIGCSDLPRVATLLRAYFAGTSSMGPPLARRWALNHAEDKAPWTASTLTVWLQTAYTTAGHEPPPGFCWTSHSLRKGAASAAYAIRVRLDDIRYAGGWSTKSTVLEAKYVDFTMKPTKAALLFFGYMKKDCPS